MILTEEQQRVLDQLGETLPGLKKRLLASGDIHLGSLFNSLGSTTAAVKMLSSSVSTALNSVSVGFQLTQSDGTALAQSVLIELAVFQDSGLSTPATNATLDTASKGTIISGAGSAALKVQTDATGAFSCTMSDLINETVTLACSPTFGSLALDCRDVTQVTFT